MCAHVCLRSSLFITKLMLGVLLWPGLARQPQTIHKHIQRDRYWQLRLEEEGLVQKIAYRSTCSCLSASIPNGRLGVPGRG